MKDYTGAVLLDKDNRVYLIKEKDVNNIGQDRWNLPGGSVDIHESLTDSIKRETKEETGYNSEVISLLGCYKSVKNDKSWLYIVFELHAKGGQAGLIDENVTEGKWFSKEEFLNLDGSQIVHPDIKLVYKIAINGKGLPLDTVKLIRYF